MKYNCIIVDDERPALKLLTAYIEKLPNLELVASCENAFEAFAALQDHDVDILFLDIQMPELTGIELLHTLKTKPQVILTTAYREYAVTGFELDVTDYLIKPFSFERFMHAVNKATEVLNLKYRVSTSESHTALLADEKSRPSADVQYFYVKNQNRIEPIRFEDILYLESMREYISLHTEGKRYLIHRSMNSMKEELPNHLFIRVHRSFIVALNRIDSITGNSIQIGDKQVAIGRSYRKAFFEKIRMI